MQKLSTGMLGLVAVFLSWTFLPTGVQAAPVQLTPNFSIAFGYVGSYIHYSSDSGTQDHGYLNGFDINTLNHSTHSLWGLGQVIQKLHFSFLAGVMASNSDPALSPSRYFDFESQCGLNQSLMNQNTLGEYLIVGDRVWSRSFNTLTYQNFYIGLGVQTHLVLNKKMSMGLHLSGRWSPMNALNTVATGNTLFYAGPGSNFKISLPVSERICNHCEIQLIPYDSYWHFKSENAHTSIFEPTNTTNELAVKLAMCYGF
jgi:hypothetical protein